MFDDRELFDGICVIGVGLFLKVLDEGCFIIDKFACEDDEISFDEFLEVSFRHRNDVHLGLRWVTWLLTRNKSFF